MLLLCGCLVACVKEDGVVCPVAGRHMSTSQIIRASCRADKISPCSFSSSQERDRESGEENLHFSSPLCLHLKKKKRERKENPHAHLFPEHCAGITDCKQIPSLESITEKSWEEKFVETDVFLCGKSIFL